MSGIFVFAIAVGNSVSELHGDGDIITGIQLAIPVISSYPFVETVE
jgi:hypothetical protein